MQRIVMFKSPSQTAAIICLVICTFFKFGSTSEASDDDLVISFNGTNVSTKAILQRLNITGNFRLSAFCPTDEHSCQMRCIAGAVGNLTERQTKLPCYCDSHCSDIGDCCYDFFKRCSQVQQSHESRPGQWQCVNINSFGSHGYIMKTKCPQATTVPEIQNLCEIVDVTDFLSAMPVVDEQTGVIYRNVFCARCNSVQSVSYWRMTADCGRIPASALPQDHTLLLAFVRENCTVNYNPTDAQQKYLKHCLATENSCSSKEIIGREPVLQQICSLYAFPVCGDTNRKNPHCVLCNGYDITHLNCGCPTVVTSNPATTFGSTSSPRTLTPESTPASQVTTPGPTGRPQTTTHGTKSPPQITTSGTAPTLYTTKPGTTDPPYPTTTDWPSPSPSTTPRLSIPSKATRRGTSAPPNATVVTIEVTVNRSLLEKTINPSIVSRMATNPSLNVQMTTSKPPQFEYYSMPPPSFPPISSPSPRPPTTFPHFTFPPFTFPPFTFPPLPTFRPPTSLPPTYPPLPPPLNILFDFSSNKIIIQSKKTKTKILQQKSCQEGFVYDPFLEKCREAFRKVILNTKSSRNSTNSSSDVVKTLNCSSVQLNFSDTTLYPNETLWVPLYATKYNRSDYFINGSYVFLCTNFSGNYSKEEQIATWSYAVSPLQILTYAGSSVSILSLLILLVVYCIFRELRTLPGKNLINLSIAMIFYHIFLFVAGFRNVQELCTGIAILLHYFVLCSFAWMSIMAFDVLKTFVFHDNDVRSPQTRNHNKTLLKYSVCAWGLPAILVLACFTLDYTDTFKIGYGFGGFCWIKNGTAVLAIVGVPVALVILFNFITLTWTVVSIYKIRKVTDNLGDQGNHSSLAVLYIKLTFVLGLTWVFGFISAIVKTDATAYLFVVVNSLQGFFICLTFIAKKRTVALLRGPRKQHRERGHRNDALDTKL